MAKEGANIAIADTNVEKADITAQEIQTLGVKTLAIRLDVSDPDEVSSAFTSFINEFEQLDILVNNAALMAEAATDAGDIDVEVRNGVVQLSGFVGSAAEKKRATEVAMGIKGVTKVDNALDIKN
jgi:NAD(P)-dependent dehydrogenase (short-subunit alcohol dehydrogenase family)